MLGSLVIVFREVIEIALVLSIVMAATRGMPGRLRLALAGLGLGVFGAMLVAFFTDRISQAIDGVGQEVFNAAIMFIAVGFLSWTVIWMKRHGREMSRHLKELKTALDRGEELTTLVTEDPNVVAGKCRRPFAFVIEE